MGTPFDTFSSAAHTANATGSAARNRAALKRFMEAQGFIKYDQEWWHFSFEVPNPTPVRYPSALTAVSRRLACRFGWLVCLL